MIILSVESSCDETSVAVTKDGKEVLSNVVLSQIDIHKRFGGVVPEVASRAHIEMMNYIFIDAIKIAGIAISEIDLVAVTQGPGLIGSLLVGINAATAFAYANNIKIIGVNHLLGHIYAANIEHDIKFPSLCLLVSGGHTELIYLRGHNDIKLLGTTLDDAVGEAYDKVARLLDLGYPGGPVVDKLAKTGNPDIHKLPRPYLKDDPFNFSFSGIKSAVLNLVNKLKMTNVSFAKEDICASFQESVTDVLVYKVKNALNLLEAKQLIIAGGVAANSLLREKMKKEINDYEILIPSIKYCTDQAAMIGIAAYFQQNNTKVDGYVIKGTSSMNFARYNE